MSANIIDGKAFAASVRQKVASKVADLKETHSITPGLAVVLVGEEEGLAAARQAVEMIAGGAEHGTVLNFLERDRRRSRISNRQLESIEVREDVEMPATGFEELVPGLSDLAQRRSRRMRASQVDPEDEEAVIEMMELAEDEDVSWEEE